MRILTLIAAGVMIAPLVPAQIVPKFEVASIKPCPAGASSRDANGLAGIRTSPGRLTASCAPLIALIQHAYLVYENGRYRDFNFYDVPIEGAPAWTRSERYMIQATAPGAPNEGIMNGPMLQALLEDRFQLRIRVRTRDAPVFELVVAKDGPKLQSFDGNCAPVDWTKTPQSAAGPNDCRNTGGVSGTNTTRYWRAITIDEFIAAALDRQFVGRPVVNRTGIEGLFDIRLAFTPEQASDAPDAGSSIFTAIQQQLGLKLVPARGLERFLVIDRVAKPSGN